MSSITVFTPTYNRKELLKRCFESLKAQTISGFTWMIIDDGSTDNTRADVEQWKKQELSFTLEYYYKKNGGLHTAYNLAIEKAKTDLCVCVDSDDFMPEDALERILKKWNEQGNDSYAGIVGLDYTISGKCIGDKLPNQKQVNLIDLMLGKYPLKNGDRTVVVRTELYKQVAPMKVFEGEKNFNPHYMHLEISKKYDFLVLNENLKFVEYQPGGMSDSMLKQYKNSPQSFAEHRIQYLNFKNTSVRFKFHHSIHLVSSCILSGKFTDAMKRTPCKFITFCAIPFGIVLSIYIKIKTRG